MTKTWKQALHASTWHMRYVHPDSERAPTPRATDCSKVRKYAIKPSGRAVFTNASIAMLDDQETNSIIHIEGDRRDVFAILASRPLKRALRQPASAVAEGWIGIRSQMGSTNEQELIGETAVQARLHSDESVVLNELGPALTSDNGKLTLAIEVPAKVNTAAGILNVRLDIMYGYPPRLTRKSLNTLPHSTRDNTCAFTETKWFGVFNDTVVEAVMTFVDLGGRATAHLLPQGIIELVYSSEFIRTLAQCKFQFSFAAMDKAILWTLENAGYASPLEVEYSSVSNGNAFFIARTEGHRARLGISRPYGRWRDGTPIKSKVTGRDSHEKTHALFMASSAKYTIETSRNRPRCTPLTDEIPTHETYSEYLIGVVISDDVEDTLYEKTPSIEYLRVASGSDVAV